MLSFISGNQKTFVLPDYKDAFWDEVFLLRTYGIDQQYDIALFANERLWGLSFFLSHIPPKWWSDQFDQSTERFLDCFLENKSYATTIEGKIVSIYQSSLLENTVKSKNEEMASQLIKAAIPEAATQIAGVLSMTAYESFVIDRGFLLDYTLLESSPAGVWSNAFCAKMIEEAFSEIEKGKYYTLQYLPKAVASHLDPNVEKVLEKYHEKAKEISYFTSWEKYFYDPLKSIFSIKKLVDSYPIEE